jgi:autotransporter-associated beta strand protein
VVLGFPFESIVGGEQRAAVMGRVLEGLGVAPDGNAMLLEVDAGEEVVDATPRAGGEQLVKRGAGTVILTAASQHSGGTLVEAGTLVIRDPAALGSGGLVVKAGSRVVVDLGGMQLPLAALDLAAGATLDLGAGAIRIAPGGLELAMLQSLVTAGRAGGSWTGAGITSSAAVGQPFYAVGIRPLADGSLLAGFAAVGDANLDGSVDIQDLILVSAGGRYGSGAADAGWWQGDFNDDRRVTIGDLVILVASSLYGAGPYRPLGSTAVAASW